MPQDEFELLLERCNERLSEIELSVPALESGAPRARVYSLALAPAPPVRPAQSPPAPPTLSGIDEPAPPAAAEPEEDEVFPPPRVPARTPPPSVPLWSAPPEPTPAQPAAPAGRRRLAGAAAAAALAAAGGLGVWLERRPPAELDLEIGDADAMAVRPEKGDLLVAEGKELVDLSRDGRTLGRRPLDAEVDSMSWGQDSLWTSDGRTSSVVEHADGGRSTVFTLNHVPGALYVHDKYLWTAEKDGRTLHEFLISRSILGAILQPLDSFSLDGILPEAFTIDDSGTLWVADKMKRRLYRLRLENGSYKPASSAPLSPFLGPEGRLRDLTVEEGAVWILSQPAGGGRASLRRIPLGRFDWTPA